MMDQNSEIWIMWFLRICLKFSKRRRLVPLRPIWTIMVAAKLDQSTVLVTKLRQNRLTLKSRSAGQRHIDRQTNSAENNGPSGLQSSQHITIHVYTSVSSSFRETLTQRLKCRTRSFSSVVAAREREPIMGVFGRPYPNGVHKQSSSSHGSWVEAPWTWSVFQTNMIFCISISALRDHRSVSTPFAILQKCSYTTNDPLNHSVHKPIAWL